MRSIIWFDVCSFFVLAALLVVYYAKYNVPFKKYSIFLFMVWCAVLSAVASMCNAALQPFAPIWLLRLLNAFYFTVHGLILPALVLYVFSLTDHTLGGWHRLIPGLLPSAFLLLLSITSWQTDSLFRIDGDGFYHRAKLMVLVYLVAIYNLLFIGNYLVRNRRRIPRQEFISVFTSIILAGIGMVIQMLWPSIPVENFSIALCLMSSQLTVQNPELILDGSTGMLNKQGFASLTAPILDEGTPFQVGFLLVDNYHELEKIYGFNRVESRVSILADYLRQHSGSIFARMDTRLFCFVPENFQNTPGWNDLLEDLEQNSLASYMAGRKLGVRFQLKLGVLSCPQDVDSFGSLMDLIDMAAKLPMSKNQSVMRLNPVDVVRLRRRKQIDELVRSAVTDGSLSLVFQPIYNVQEDRFCSAEALLRMNTEKLGSISPMEFIQIAEENGSIVQLTRFVVESVCSFLRGYNMPGLGLRRIHVNLSAIDCAQSDLAVQITDSVRRAGIEPDMLSVEITETAFSSMPDSILANLTNLSRAGFSIMLDDYGTGYSNLNRLYSMPLDVVKLDRSLVQDILTSEAARIVLENTILMMKRLNKQVLVEGVENKDQADYLIAHGVNYIQGFYYAMPMDGAHLEALFRRQTEEGKNPIE